MMAAPSGGNVFEPSTAFIGTNIGTQNNRWATVCMFDNPYNKGSSPSLSFTYGTAAFGATTDRYYYPRSTFSHPIYGTLVGITGGAGNSYPYQNLAWFNTSQHFNTNPAHYYGSRTQSSQKGYKAEQANHALTDDFHTDRSVATWSWKVNSSNQNHYTAIVEMDPAASNPTRMDVITYGNYNAHSTILSSQDLLINHSYNSSNQFVIKLTGMNGTGGSFAGGFSSFTFHSDITHPANASYGLQYPQAVGDTNYMVCWSNYNQSGTYSGSSIRYYMFVYDLSNPASPVLEHSSSSRYDMTTPKTGYHRGGKTFFAVGGNSSNTTYLHHWDFTDPTNPSYARRDTLSSYLNNALNIDNSYYGWSNGDSFLCTVCQYYQNTHLERVFNFEDNQTITLNTFDGHDRSVSEFVTNIPSPNYAFEGRFSFT